MRVSDRRAEAIRDYKHGSENEPGSEARELAADLLDERAHSDKLAEALRYVLDTDICGPKSGPDADEIRGRLGEIRLLLAEHARERTK